MPGSYFATLKREYDGVPAGTLFVLYNDVSTILENPRGLSCATPAPQHGCSLDSQASRLWREEYYIPNACLKPEESSLG